MYYYLYVFNLLWKLVFKNKILNNFDLIFVVMFKICNIILYICMCICLNNI